MDDLTILYVTANEMPQRWQEFQLYHLLKSADGSPIISLSRQPMNIGLNVLDEEPKSYWNIYMQMLRGAMLATTPFVAMAEDDVLYTKTHFDQYRPPPDKVSYDRSRWSLFAWEPEPMYCLRNRLSNCSLIAPRELLIDSLRERAAKWPAGAPNNITGEVGRDKVARWLGVRAVPCVEWYSFGPIVQLNHIESSEERQQTKWKRHGEIRAYDIPYWGKAADIVSIYRGERA